MGEHQGQSGWGYPIDAGRLPQRGRPDRSQLLHRLGRQAAPRRDHARNVAHGARGEPNCQSIAGAPIDEAIGALITAEMTPAWLEVVNSTA